MTLSIQKKEREMKRKYIFLTGLLITGPAFASPVSPLQQNKQPIVQSEVVVNQPVNVRKSKDGRYMVIETINN